MKYILIFFFFLEVNAQKVSKPNFYLLDKTEYSDFNVEKIKMINSESKGRVMLDSVFNVVKGNYTVYRFLTYDSGVLFDESGILELNEIIILKVNKKNKIVDGYKYFLQNPVMPSTCNLYRITRKIRVRPIIKIQNFKFKKVHQEKKGFEVCDEISLFLDDQRTLNFD